MRRASTYLKTAALVMTGSLLISCGGSQKTTASASAEREEKPRFEHEVFGDRHRTRKTTSATLEEEKPIETEENLHLWDFIEDWKGTPHRMGGNTKNGVDCSGFVIRAYREVYDENFRGRRAEDLFGETEPLKRKELREGDLVFFKINGRRIDHVGIYLGNDEFVHVSSSRGVMVSNLNEAYFAERFFMGGRYK